MKALILSCNTGGGHNSAAKAIAEEFHARGDEAYVLDYLCLASKKVSRLVGDGYVQIVKKTPLLFGLVYKLGMLISRITRKSPVYYINGRMAKYLNDYLKANPVDVLVMPHLYPSETVTYMKRKGMKLPLTVAVMTDYTCIPFWEETDCDHYILAHEALRKSCVKRGIPNEKIQTFGIPVAKKCRVESSKEDARKELGLSLNQKYFLTAGGSMGAGDFIELIQKLVSNTSSEQILAICGNNRKAEKKLRKKFKEEPRVIVLGYTEQMPLYLRACDVVFTKPGGLTSTEAAVIGVPMVHTAPIPGCETINRRFFMRAGMSWSAITLRGQVNKGIRLMNDPNAQRRMLERQAKQIHKDAVEQIYDFIAEQLHQENSSL